MRLKNAAGKIRCNPLDKWATVAFWNTQKVIAEQAEMRTRN
jgi:hypothetical protein